MATSLDKLVNKLSKDAFSNVKGITRRINIIYSLEKGLYPYEYIDSPKTVKETQLPPKEAFYFRLYD